MEPITIRREQQGHRGAFFLERDGSRAELTFSASPDGKLVMLDHTEVAPPLRGQGFARSLVEAAVVWAREQQVRLVPVCPVASAIFAREPAFRDVLG